MITKTEATGNIPPRPPEGKHSPLPWTTARAKMNELFIHEPGGRIIAYVRHSDVWQEDEQDQIDGDFICKAVNLHKKLVAALEAISKIHDGPLIDDEYYDAIDKVLKRYGIEALLKEAQEKSK